ncbi:MAG: hypothetical protein Unbinned767contig1000_17 [Prokaryotic dsDNA virus sp.]|nr:MAG: hypothetical protein Unbinned767contig1000_17 [Prokaryotic dsDNA virus sp.]|tara:strand:- start:6489 stop:8705 length:2217 start_codon:yes stop_codon:yes gene_type:complete
MAHPTLIGKKFVIQQTATQENAEVWSTAGVSRDFKWADVAVQDSGGNTYPAFHHGPNLYMKVPLGTSSSSVGQKVEVTVVANPSPVAHGSRSASKGADRRIRLSSWIIDRIDDLLPSFTVEHNGTTITAPAVTIRKTEEGPVRMRVEWFTKFSETPLWVKGWFDIYDEQELVEMRMIAGFGTINDATNLDYHDNLRNLRVRMSEMFMIDFAANRGLGTMTQTADGRYSHMIAQPGNWQATRWTRGMATMVTGAILCRPKDTSLAVGDARWDNMQHRLEGPVKAMMKAEDWEGHFGVFGHVPWIDNGSGGAQSILNDIRSELADGMGSTYRGIDWMYRYGRASGQGSQSNPQVLGFDSNVNGEAAQHDHGFTHGSHILTNNEPALLHHYTLAFATWLRGPGTYLYNDGSTLRYDNHSGLYTYYDLPWGGAGATQTLGFSRGGDNDVFTSSNMKPPVYSDGYLMSHVTANMPCVMVEMDDCPVAAQYLDLKCELLRADNNLPNVLGNAIPGSSTGAGPNGGGWGVGHNGPVATTNETVAETRGWGRGAHVAAYAWKVGTRSKSCRDFVRELLTWVKHADRMKDTAYDNKPMRPWDGNEHTTGAAIIGIKLWMEAIMNSGMWSLLDSPGLVTLKADRTFLENRTYESSVTCLTHLLRGSAGSWDPLQVYSWNYGDPWPEAVLNQSNQTVVYRNWAGWWYQQMFQRLAKDGIAKAVAFCDDRANYSDTDANYYSLRRELPNV